MITHFRNTIDQKITLRPPLFLAYPFKFTKHYQFYPKRLLRLMPISYLALNYLLLHFLKGKTTKNKSLRFLFSLKIRHEQ